MKTFQVEFRYQDRKNGPEDNPVTSRVILRFVHLPTFTPPALALSEFPVDPAEAARRVPRLILNTPTPALRRILVPDIRRPE